MAADKKKIPDFENTSPFDPVHTATGSEEQKSSSVEEKKSSSRVDKKKAGFYLASDLLERFDRAFYALKLEGVDVSNKSSFVETALRFALDDLEKKKDSRIRRILEGEAET
ncbi:MAG: hypothetical protein SWH68_15970 [Thermodesulfobacteriota bacterium]|nr:hypothetical protein [Thermodesulfobacteriota bacterium]